MTPEQTVVACLVLHVLADFPLQTVGHPSLADLKQKAWWDKALENRDREDVRRRNALLFSESDRRRHKYGKDYQAALGCHSLVWAALTFLPLCTAPGWSVLVAANAVIHYLVDDLKANRLAINLREDQTLHLLQIVLTIGAFWGFRWLLGG